MPLVRITRRYRFSASHRLHSELLSDRENAETYGKCNNPYGHGHDYVLEVTLRGPVDPSTGRFVALEALDQFVRRVVVDPMDRRDLNQDIAEFQSLVPTSENLAVVIAQRLQTAWPVTFPNSVFGLEKVRIHETRRNIFELRLSTGSARITNETEAAVAVRQ